MKLKKTLAIVSCALASVMAFSFTACDNTETPPEKTPQETVEPAVTEYTVTFNANGGTLTGNSTVSVESGKKITGAPTAAKEGSTFNGWYTAATGGTKVDLTTYEVTSAVTLYAQYTVDPVTPTEYTVTFNANGGTLTGNSTVSVEEGKKITGAPIATKEGSTFNGWYTAATGGTKVDLTAYEVTSAVTLYAQYTEIPHGDPLMAVDTITGGYRIEAENAIVEGTPATEGSPFIETVETASGGKSLGYLGVEGNTVTFMFRSASAGKANVSLLASSNNSAFDWETWMMYVNDQTVTSEIISVTLNGKAVNYSAATLRGAGIENPYVWNMYWDPIALGSLDIQEGLNTLVVTINSSTSPNIDCLDITTTLDISHAFTSDAGPSSAVVYDKEVTGKLIVGSYAAGPAIKKTVLGFTEDISASAIETNPFVVSTSGKLGNSATDKIYLSDENGNPVAGSVTAAKFVTIEYDVSYNSTYSSFNNNLSVFDYNMSTGVNTWKSENDISLTLSGLTVGDTTYTRMGDNFTAEWYAPDLDDWDLTGTFTDTGVTVGEETRDITLKYASYTPVADGKTDKKPLIIWLHGAGEGGTDPSIAILGNQVTNLAKPVIQKYFTTSTCAGAYVLAPQSPTMWMDNGSGTQGGSNVGNSVYTESLFKLIQKFVNDHSDIDANRIYIGGCSNGGWMTVEMLSKHGEYFAAAYPIAVPFDKSAGMTDDEFKKLASVPMWITHAQADTTVAIGTFTGDWFTGYTFAGYTEANSNQLYIELLKAGATDVYYSLFETVTLTGEEAATYMGHWSWIFTLRDECVKVQATTGSGEDGQFTLADLKTGDAQTETVKVDGTGVTLWGWIAAQHKAAE